MTWRSPFQITWILFVGAVIFVGLALRLASWVTFAWAPAAPTAIGDKRQ